MTSTRRQKAIDESAAIPRMQRTTPDYSGHCERHETNYVPAYGCERCLIEVYYTPGGRRRAKAIKSQTGSA